jgi:hypothetical protein
MSTGDFATQPRQSVHDDLELVEVAAAAAKARIADAIERAQGTTFAESSR